MVLRYIVTVYLPATEKKAPVLQSGNHVAVAQCIASCGYRSGASLTETGQLRFGKTLFGLFPVLVSAHCWLTSMDKYDLVFSCCISFASWFNKLCVLRCLSAQNSCKECFLCSYRLAVNMNQSEHSSLTFLINRAFPRVELSMFFHTILCQQNVSSF